MTKKEEEETKTPEGTEGDKPEEKSEVEEFLDELPKEGEPVDLEEEGEETTPESSPEKKPEKDAPSSEETKEEDAKPEPFHKHPRFRKMAKENKELRGQLEDVNTKLDQLLGRESKAVATSEGEIPGWFVNLYGNKPELWAEYNKYSQQQREAFEQGVLEKLEAKLASKEKEQSDEQAKWAQWVEDQLVDLEEEGEKFDRKALLEVMDNYTPTDGQGVPDFHKGLEILRVIGDRKTKTETQEEKDKARKEVAAKTATGGGGKTSSSSAVNPNTLKNKSFLDLVQEEE